MAFCTGRYCAVPRCLARCRLARQPWGQLQVLIMVSMDLKLNADACRAFGCPDWTVWERGMDSTVRPVWTEMSVSLVFPPLRSKVLASTSVDSGSLECHSS